MYNQLIYYSALYLLILVSRTVKVRKDVDYKKPLFTDYFLSAQEILYTAAGVSIILLNNLNNFKEGVFGIYFLLVISTAFIDSLNNDKNVSFKGWYNFGIIILVFIATIYTFLYLLPSVKANSLLDVVCKQDTTYFYKVIIPYNDNTLIKHVGKEKFKTRKLVYIQTFETKNDSMAIQIAKNNFIEETDISKPIFPDTKGLIKLPIDYDDKEIILKKGNPIIN